MKRTVYLVGTDHRYQRGFALGVAGVVFADFREMLRVAISRFHVLGIAEEMSLEGLRSPWVSGDSTGGQLAAELGLVHRYCDPDSATRNLRGIITGADRERYWLDQLR